MSNRFCNPLALLLGMVFLSCVPALCRGEKKPDKKPGDKQPAAMTAKDRAFFETKIRPVLVKHCYSCHAAGAKKIGGKLRLDLADAMRKGGESGPVIVAGQPAKSLIIQSLKYEHLEMPPKSPLPKSVVKDFEDWVKMGAPDPRGEKAKPVKPNIAVNSKDPALWSFQPVKNPSLPKAGDNSWPRDSLDRFVLEKLESLRLKPTRDATPRTLARRLYFDLIGLPPTIEQLNQFESAYSQDGQKATEQLVDSLLASPHYGERWGRHWLDVARYGESNGNDGLSRNPTFPHAWRFRDYVIQSFNDDVPYARFVTEQIAGDLLPAKTPAQRDRLLIATGFLALASKPAKAMNVNFDMDVVDDQINVVSTGIMGLSVACARCHDHKHDPIPTRDYYAMAGIFKSTETMWGKAANEKLTAPPTPLHELKTVAPPSIAKKNPVSVAVTKPKQFAPTFATQYSQAIKALKPALYVSLNQADDVIRPEPGVNFTSDGFAQFTSGRIRSDFAKALSAYSVSFWFVNGTPNNAKPITAYIFSTGKNSKTPGPGDHLGIGGKANETTTGRLFIFNGPKKKQILTGKTTIPVRTWNHVVLVRDGQRVTAYLNGNPKPEFEGNIEHTGADVKSFFIGGRNDRFAPLLGRVAHFAMFDRALTSDESQQLHKATGQPRGSGKPLPADYFKGSTPASPPKALAMGVRDRSKPANCKINIKGESNKLGPSVPRGFLTACATANAPQPVNAKQSGRLELAKWLVRGDHPQTSRVMVNRIWLHLMGQAIVSTPDDFGVYGSRPSNPQLLDHLATRFVREGWSIKRMIRTIVLSRTYQQSSRADDKQFAADPANVHFGRHARRRLDAESFRDAVLTVSGQLNRQPGQGSIIQNMDVLVNQSGSLHQPSKHRSVYLCMLRNSPPPDLAAFDLPQFISVKGQRNVTTLPAHALYLLNNPFLVEQSRHFAKLAIASSGNASDEAKAKWIYRRALNREPLEQERQAAIALVHSTFRTLPSEAADEQQKRTHAWASLCQALWATNEFRYVD